MSNDSIDKDTGAGVENVGVKGSEAEGLEGSIEESEEPLTFLQILGSTLAAGIGVQTNAKRTRDFSRGKPIHFVLSGLIFAAAFVAVVVTVVRLVLSQV